MATNTKSEMQLNTIPYDSSWQQLPIWLQQQDIFQNEPSSPTAKDCLKKKFSIITSYLIKVGSLVRPFLYLLDAGTDGNAAYQHNANGDILWAWLTCLLMVLPKIVTCIMAICAVIKNREHSKLRKTYLVLRAICFAPFHLFYLIMVNAFATLKGRVNEDDIQDLEYHKLVETMLEALPQSYLQIYVMAVKYWQDRPFELWQLITFASSVIKLAFTVSTNSYLFAKIPTKTKVAFFLICIKTVFSRLAIFTGYVFLSLEHASQNNFLWLLPLVLMLSVSIGVWFSKRFYHYLCFGCVLPLTGDIHYRCDSWGTVIMTWLLTAVCNGHTHTGLLISIVNFVLAVGAVNLYAIQVGLSWGDLMFPIMSTTPTAVGLLINVMIVYVPYCRQSISHHWLSVNKEAKERILY